MQSLTVSEWLSLSPLLLHCLFIFSSPRSPSQIFETLQAMRNCQEGSTDPLDLRWVTWGSEERANPL